MRHRPRPPFRHDPVAGEVEAADAVPVEEGVVGPVVGVAPRGRGVPAVAPAFPHRGAAGRIHPGVEPPLHLGAHVEPVEAFLAEGADGAEHIGDLALEHVDDRVAAEVGVGPVEHEEVREPGDGDPEIRLGPVAPGLIQPPPAEAGHRHGRQEVEGPEPGAVDDHVRRAGGGTGRDHAAGRDALDRVGDELDVAAGQRGVPVVREQHPLAAHHVAGDALLAQPRVGDHPELAAPQLHRRRQQLLRQHEAAREQLAVEEDAQPVGLAHRREPVEEVLLGIAIGPVELGQHIGRAALVHVDLGGGLGDLGHELDDARPGAHDRHPPAGEVDLVVPAGGVPRRAGEVVAARDVRKGGPAQLADGRHDGGRLQRGAILQGEIPYGAALVELGGRHAGAETEMGPEPALVGQRVQVRQDLLPRREAAAPAAWPERERVEVRRHVAGQAGVGVVPPGPAEVGCPVEHEEVPDARLLERQRHTEPREPGADHDHPVPRMLRHRLSLALRAARPPSLAHQAPRHQAPGRRGPVMGRIAPPPSVPAGCQGRAAAAAERAPSATFNQLPFGLSP